MVNPYTGYPQPPMPPPLPKPSGYGYYAAPRSIPDWLSLSDELWEHILSFVGAADKCKVSNLG